MITLVVRAIIHQKGKYFLVKNRRSDFWSLPGGKVHEDEPIPQALEREIVEELGVRPLVGQLLYVQQLWRGKEGQRVEFFFLVNNPEEYATVDTGKTSHGDKELADAGFYALDEVNVLPEFLSTELPGLLKAYSPGALPHFRVKR